MRKERKGENKEKKRRKGKVVGRKGGTERKGGRRGRSDRERPDTSCGFQFDCTSDILVP